MIIYLIFICGLIFFINVYLKKRKVWKENALFVEYYFSLNRNYSIYVVKNRKKWEKIISNVDKYFLTDKGKIHKNKIKLFCVAYPSGEILHISENVISIPSETHWIEENEELGYEKLQEGEVEFNSSKIGIKNRKSNNPSEIYYSTEIQNNLKCKIYPIAFGGYKKQEKEFILNNVIETAYSASQFVNWYDCKEEFLMPGEKVFDPNNYSDGDGYWIYIFKTEDGEILKVGISF